MELETPFIVEDRRSLELLQRAIMEARFFSGAPGRELPGSPLMADLHEQVVDTLMEHSVASDDQQSATRLQEWLEWQNRSLERDSLVATLRGMEPAWSSWTHEAQCEVARSLMKPFTFCDEDVEALVGSANAA